MTLRTVSLVVICFLLAVGSTNAQAPPDSVLRAMVAQMDSLRVDFFFFQQHNDVYKLVDLLNGATKTVFPATMPAPAVAEHRYRDSVRHGMGWSVDSALKQFLDTAICLLRCRLDKKGCEVCGRNNLHFETMDWGRSLPPHGIFLNVLTMRRGTSDYYLLLFDRSWEHLEFEFSGGRFRRMRWLDTGEFAHFGIRRQ